ncbi:MAG: SRPBCC domain-containing protein [Clostridiales bacterium]|nr:SRPBCC domain-containing protein [Clostridiales bacterium]
MPHCATTLEQPVNATAQQLWAAWTDPDIMAQWFWPMYPDSTYATDARLGGEYRYASRKTGVGAYGVFEEVVPERLLRMTWNWVDEHQNDEEIVTVWFEDGLIRLEHIAATMDSCDMNHAAWADRLRRLMELLGHKNQA